MRIPNSLTGAKEECVQPKMRKLPILLSASIAVAVIGYFRAVAISSSWGASGVGLTGPAYFLREIGAAACISTALLVISLIRREFLWPLSLALLLPFGIYSIFYLAILLA